MMLFSLTCGMLGCKDTPKSAKHEISDITAVSISCGAMDQRCAYSFFAHKQNENWLLDAECIASDGDTAITISAHTLDNDDIEALLELLKANGSISYAENYKKPKRSHLFVRDEMVYSFCLTFTDGNQCLTSDRQSELEQFFYRLAEKCRHD